MKISRRLPILLFLSVMIASMISIISKSKNARPVYSEDLQSFEYISHFGDSANDVIIAGNKAYVASVSKVEIYDITDPLAITKEGDYSREGCNFASLAVEGSYAYVTETDRNCEGQLYVLDVSNPTNITQVVSNPITVSNVAGVEIKVTNRIAYIALAQDGLGIVDLSNFANPVVYPKYDTHAGTFSDLDVDGQTVYLANVTGGFLIIGVSDLSDIKTLLEVDFPSGQFADYHSYGIRYASGNVYLSGGERLLKIFNGQNVLDVREEYSSAKEGSLSYDIDIVGTVAYVFRKNDGVHIFDVSDDGAPELLFTQSVLDAFSKIVVHNDLVYLSGPTTGVSIYRFEGVIPEDGSPKPFLDLPWDYRAQGKTFTDAAYAINTYFDHQYPLLSTSLSENTESRSNVIGYDIDRNKQFQRFYTSHDGYDWGSIAGANYGTPQVAAADGNATYVNTCGACGNAIFIDHGNGYQTRYYHLQENGLITNTPNVSVPVERGQQIGLTGFSGNIRPNNETGSHIHFMVVQDKNSDGSFNDNIPDGLTDPFGWQSNDADPWEHYSFTYKDVNRTGNKSSYLWNSLLANRNDVISFEGGTLETEHFRVVFPANSYESTFHVDLTSAPIVIVSESRNSLGPSLIFTSSTLTGDEITEFSTNFTLFFDFEGLDLSSYDLQSLAIYSSQDGVNWSPEVTDVNFETHIASIQVNHLTHFALMADRQDSHSPETDVDIEGGEGELNRFMSDVTLTLSVTDDSDIAYTAYSINEQNALEYSAPLVFTDEGSYEVAYFSEDIHGNVEAVQSVVFTIDKTIPEADIYFDPITGNIVISTSEDMTTIDYVDSKKEQSIVLVDMAGNILTITGKYAFFGNHQYISIKSLTYNGIIYQVDTNKFAITRENSDNVFQSWLTRNYQVRLSYPYRDIYTRVHTVQNGTQYSTIEEGLKILHQKTNRGLVEYEYE